MRSGELFYTADPARLTVSVMRTPNASAWLSSVAADADGEFLSCVSQDDEDIYAISCGGETVGLALAAIGAPSFLYVYIFLPFRGRGFGTAAICRLEEMLGKTIQTCCRFDDAPALRFLVRMGYTQDFTSSYMVYSGLNHTLADVPIRPYTAADFEAAHRLTAEAFHKMRLASGQFPNSKIEEPDAETETDWNETAHRRFVYECGGKVTGLLELGDGIIETVAVAPALQKRGIGTHLIRFAVNHLLEEGHQEIGLYCVTNNPARYLYEKLGFTEHYRNMYAIKKQ